MKNLKNWTSFGVVQQLLFTDKGGVGVGFGMQSLFQNVFFNFCMNEHWGGVGNYTYQYICSSLGLGNE